MPVARLDDGRELLLPATIAAEFELFGANGTMKLVLTEGVYQIGMFRIDRDPPLTATELAEVTFGAIRGAIVESFYVNTGIQITKAIWPEVEAVRSGADVLVPSKQALDAVAAWHYCLNRAAGQQPGVGSFSAAWLTGVTKDMALAFTQRAFRLRKSGVILQEGPDAKNN